MSRYRLSHLGTAAVLAALALGGCNRNPAADQAQLANQSAAAAPLPTLPATLPMNDAPAAQAVAAPPAAALPGARPIRTVRVRDTGRGADYAWADAAWQFSDALGDAPPDYGFDYDGVQPWAWQGYDNSLVFAEPVSGGYRTYYYRPGDEQPYFVRDPYYGYGYDDGQLAVVYAEDGAVVPWADYGPQALYASRYLTRGRDLWRASRGDRISISAQSWTTYNNNYFIGQQRWSQARARQPIWTRYAQQDAATQNHWRAEQTRRAADARRFASWQAQGFRAAPPPRAIPAAWQRAAWARDTRRFAPAAVPAADVRNAGQNQALAAQRQQQARKQMMQAQMQARQQQMALQSQQREKTQALAERQQIQERQRQQAAFQSQRQQQARAAAQQRQLAQREQMQVRGRQQAIRQGQERQQQQAEAQQRMRAQRQQVETRARQRQAAAQAERQQQAAAQRKQQAQARAADAQQRRQQAVRAQQQQQAGVERAAAQRAQGAARAQQQQARAAAMAQRKEQQGMQQAQARGAQMSQRAEPRPSQPRPEPSRREPHRGQQMP